MALSRERFAAWGLIGGMVLVATLPLIHWGFVDDWHDQQRIGQVLFIFVCGFFAVSVLGRGPSPHFIDANMRRVVVTIFLLGLLSAWRARQPLWAFVEFAVQFGCVGVAWWVAITRVRVGEGLDRALLWIVFGACVSHILQFVTAYIAFGMIGLGGMDPFLILDGFSNPRFYGQFITLSLPILALPLMLPGFSRGGLFVCFAMLSMWWGIAFISGSRGAWLGISFAMLILSFSGELGRRWVMWNLLAALVGLIVCWVCVSGIPDLMGLAVQNHPGNRLTTDLSCREVIWALAARMISERPLLGFGPMHFADQVTWFECGMAAHPHQAWLQWASEWGVPSALLMSWLVLKGCMHAFHGVSASNGGCSRLNVLKICLFASVLGALSQSMVDGVFVMPNTELWLAVCFGWLVGVSFQPSSERGAAALHHWGLVWRWSFFAAGCLLVLVVVRDVPRLNDRKNDFAEAIGGHGMPRFWSQGVISYEK